MKKYKVISQIFTFLGIVLGLVMCSHVGIEYYNHIQHPEYSAPASVSFLIAIPYMIFIVIVFTVAYFLNKRYKNMHQ
jgi:hypothetical protein